MLAPLTKLLMRSAPPRAARTALGLKKFPMMLWRVRRGGLASCWVVMIRDESSDRVKLLEFRNGGKDFRGELGVEVRFPLNK